MFLLIKLIAYVLCANNEKIENIELILSDLSIYDWCNQERVSNLTEEIKLCFQLLEILSLGSFIEVGFVASF